MPHILITGSFLYELLFLYLSFTYCRNMVGKNIPLDILLGMLLTAVASAMFKTFLFRMFEFGAQIFDVCYINNFAAVYTC